MVYGFGGGGLTVQYRPNRVEDKTSLVQDSKEGNGKTGTRTKGEQTESEKWSEWELEGTGDGDRSSQTKGSRTVCQREERAEKLIHSCDQQRHQPDSVARD